MQDVRALAIKNCGRHSHAVTAGVVQHIEPTPADRLGWQRDEVESVFVLHRAPHILVQIDGIDNDTGLGPGVSAVEAHLRAPSN